MDTERTTNLRNNERHTARSDLVPRCTTCQKRHPPPCHFDTPRTEQARSRSTAMAKRVRTASPTDSEVARRLTMDLADVMAVTQRCKDRDEQGDDEMEGPHGGTPHGSNGGHGNRAKGNPRGGHKNTSHRDTNTSNTRRRPQNRSDRGRNAESLGEPWADSGETQIRTHGDSVAPVANGGVNKTNLYLRARSNSVPSTARAGEAREPTGPSTLRQHVTNNLENKIKPQVSSETIAPSNTEQRKIGVTWALSPTATDEETERVARNVRVT